MRITKQSFLNQFKMGHLVGYILIGASCYFVDERIEKKVQHYTLKTQFDDYRNSQIEIVSGIHRDISDIKIDIRELRKDIMLGRTSVKIESSNNNYEKYTVRDSNDSFLATSNVWLR